jgi:hypothetical protein
MMIHMDIQTYIINILGFLDFTLLPFIIAIGLLFFIWNGVKYFVFQSATEEGRDSAKRLMIYGIAAFILSLSLWGIVNLTIATLYITSTEMPCPDFNPNCHNLNAGNGSALDSTFPGGTNVGGTNNISSGLFVDPTALPGAR